MIKQIFLTLAFTTAILLLKGQNLSIESGEQLFKLNKVQLDSVLKAKGYIVHEKITSMVGTTSYHKSVSGELYNISVTYSKGKLKLIGWDEHIYMLQNFVHEISETDYNIVENKTSISFSK